MSFSRWRSGKSAAGTIVSPQSALDGPLGGVELFSDLGGGPAVLVKADGLVDLVGGDAGATHGNFVTAKYPADGFAVDPELVAQFVDGGAGR